MLVYYFVPFIVSNPYLLFWVSNGHNSVTVQNRTHVYMKFFHHKDLGIHLLQLCPKVVKHPVYMKLINLKENYWIINFFHKLFSNYLHLHSYWWCFALVGRKDALRYLKKYNRLWSQFEKDVTRWQISVKMSPPEHMYW